MATRKKTLSAGIWVVLGIFTAMSGLSAQGENRPQLPEDVPGGVIVVLEAESVESLVDLRRSDAFFVQAFCQDEAHVAKLRRELDARGLYGKICVDRWDGCNIPVIDNVVNVLIDAQGAADESEILRVLTPDGIAQTTHATGPRTIHKPRPDAIDEWTHYLHGPDNNAVAEDTVVGPPGGVQWQADPKWTRHHDHMSSFSAMVSAGGRIFYILDEGSHASIFLPSHWALICRDAFNGKLLWKRAIPEWYTRFKGLKDGPADAPRRLVATQSDVFVTLDLHGPVVRLNARTGEIVATYPQTSGAEEILLDGGVLYVLIGPGSIGDGGRLVRPAEKRTLAAVSVDSGKTLWTHEDVVAALTPAVDEKHLYYFNFVTGRITALDRRSGQVIWHSEEAFPAPEKQYSYFASKLVVSDGVVLLACGEESGIVKSGGGAVKSDTLAAVSAATGKTLWKAPHPPSGYSSPEDLFVIDGLVWCHASSNGRLSGEEVAYDLKTGEVRARFAPNFDIYWFHHRCYPGRATVNYVMTSRTGIEFVDLKRQSWDLNHWVRGACVYGIMACNGLVYSPPAPCICYAETMLHHFTALAPEPRRYDVVDDDKRLEPGPAYDAPLGREATDADWPTYRGRNDRAGYCPQPVELGDGIRWQTDIGGTPSSLVEADGKVFVAVIDRHQVLALDADTGKEVWRFTAGGRVDSPPTYYRGRLLFGSADGYVYCLRASDGALAWRFLAAPCDRRTMIKEQFESLWPVHGSVLIHDGVAYFVAGRNLFCDGGMRLYRLDAVTGRLLSWKALDDKDPKTGKDIHDTVQWLNMAVGRPDVLSTDGRYLYMRSQVFTFEGDRPILGPKVYGPKEGERQGGETTHLFCPTGFLDDTSFHRTYWLYAETWSSGWNGYYVAGKYAPAGKIMVVGPDRVFAFGREPQFYRWTTPLEFRLYSAAKIWKPAPNPVMLKSGAKTEKTTAGVVNPHNYAWTQKLPILVRAMVLAGDVLFTAGPPDVLDESKLKRTGLTADDLAAVHEQEEALQGRHGAELLAISARDGRLLERRTLTQLPIFDGMIAARGRLLVAISDGRIVCIGR
ncbi:outer membrane protein assembly factor BamB family protein [Thermostilla marina]